MQLQLAILPLVSPLILLLRGWQGNVQMVIAYLWDVATVIKYPLAVKHLTLDHLTSRKL